MMKNIADQTIKRAISRNSYAKINLFLEILSKRDDGYHEILTLFSEVDLHDEITFALTKETGIKIVCNAELGAIEDNTIYRAANLIRERFGIKSGVEIKLNKKIPVSAGLGGGSSNAACTINGLAELWNLKLTEEEKNDIGSRIGSDVNFFLYGGTALGKGRGEIIETMEDIYYDMILLVKPDFGISSGFAYSLVEEYGSVAGWQQLLAYSTPAHCFNRLETGLRKRYNKIDEIITYMESKGAVKALLSGSGSTVIGIYEERDIFDDHYQYYIGKGVWCCQTKTKRRIT